MSALGTGHLDLQEYFPGTYFCYRLCRLYSWKVVRKWNPRPSDFSAVLQAPEPPHAHKICRFINKLSANQIFQPGSGDPLVITTNWK